MKRLYYIFSAVLFIFVGCEFKLNPADKSKPGVAVEVLRYDRIESRYLTTGDFAALQQMNMDFPMETRTLIEDVLQLGEVSDPGINSKFLAFYQDTILQSIIIDAQMQYVDMSDINNSLCDAFMKLKRMVPDFSVPLIYAQIGALNQSIIVGDGSIGISLDKYLGQDYPLYKKYYSASQRSSMNRENIVPDCLCFYLLSLYKLDNHDLRSQKAKDFHIAKIMWTVNKVTGRKSFRSAHVDKIDVLMRKNQSLSVSELLKKDMYQ